MFTICYADQGCCLFIRLNMTMMSEVILAAVCPLVTETTKAHASSTTTTASKKASEEGYIGKWDMSSGVNLGNPFREFNASVRSVAGSCLLAAYPPLLPSMATPAFVTCNASTGGLLFYATGKERPIHRFFGLGKISAMAVSGGGDLLAVGGEDGKLQVWHIESGECLMAVDDAHLQTITSLKFTTDSSLIVSASGDGTCKVWSWHQGKGATPILTLSDARASINDIHVGFGMGRNCRLLTASTDRMIRMYDLVDGLLLAEVALPSPITTVTMTSVEGFIFAGCQDGGIYVIDLASDEQQLRESNAISYSTKCSMKLSAHTSPITAISLSLMEDTLVSADAKGTIILWSLASRQPIRRISVDGFTVRSLLIVSKSSLEHSTGSKLIVNQPKRSLANPPSLLITPTNNTLGASSLMSTSTSTANGISTSTTIVDMEPLKASYARLLDYVLHDHTLKHK